MKLLITGICGFVGSSLAGWFKENHADMEILGLDNLSRHGSETNRLRLKKMGMNLRHGDVRCASDYESLPAVDWVIDAAANPSVLAGTDGRSSSRQLVEHNLLATVNLLEYCRRTKAGCILPSTSRVYSIPALAALPMDARSGAFILDTAQRLPPGVSPQGISEEFSTAAPVSLYGSTKLASETLILEYGAAFGFPVWINRCGVLAGAGQFGTAEQGIFSFWLHAYAHRHPLRYIGFEGRGYQVRDCLHPDDLGSLFWKQMQSAGSPSGRLFTVGGGVNNAMSLAQLSSWCADRFGVHSIESDRRPRRFDIPWMVMDSAKAELTFDWKVTITLPEILTQIAGHVEANPGWSELTSD